MTLFLIDTLPLELGSDVLTVVSKVKAAVIVAKKDVTLAADLQNLKQQLALTDAKILGSVFLDA